MMSESALVQCELNVFVSPDDAILKVYLQRLPPVPYCDPTLQEDSTHDYRMNYYRMKVGREVKKEKE